jgi:ABC-type branched-subunit amino acid transport system ATPase component/ABC-type branched-subunit amino acid transport system permease subunit
VTATAVAGAWRDARASWHPRVSIAAAAFAVAAFAPLFAGDARTADLAGGLYLACAAVGLAFAVGIAGLPSLAQGAFVAVGAVAGAHLPPWLGPFGGGLAAAAAASVVALLFVGLSRAAFAAATWIVAWTFAFALDGISWFVGGSEGRVVGGGPTPSQHYELALGLTALAVIGYAALARSPFGLQLAAARDREAAAASLRVPVRRLRVAALTASGAVAGVAGALAVQLAGVGDPSQYDPYLSFRLFVVVLLGGAFAALGAPVGMLVLAALSVAADAIGSLEDVAAARSHELLAAILLLGVVSLGWDGIVRPVRPRRTVGVPTALRTAQEALHARALTKRYGAVVAADAVTLSLEPGTVTALVGPNGSGKTTVLRLLAGAVAPDAGAIGGATPVRTLQATAVFPTLTPLEHLLVASAQRRRYGGLARSLFSTPKHRAEDRAFTGWAHDVLSRFGLPADLPAGELPVSDQRALMLAAAYATGAGVLLVDEPAAGSSVAESARIAELLRSLRAEGLALLVVEHNAAVVARVADRVITIESGAIA